MNYTVECIAIILIIASVSLGYLRSNKKHFALSVLPITIVPLFDLLAQPIVACIPSISDLGIVNAHIICDVIALSISLILCSLCSTKFNKKSGTVYLVIATVFNIFFTLILIISKLQIILDK